MWLEQLIHSKEKFSLCLNWPETEVSSPQSQTLLCFSPKCLFHLQLFIRDFLVDSNLFHLTKVTSFKDLWYGVWSNYLGSIFRPGRYQQLESSSTHRGRALRETKEGQTNGGKGLCGPGPLSLGSGSACSGRLMCVYLLHSPHAGWLRNQKSSNQGLTTLAIWCFKEQTTLPSWKTMQIG
jgi:hypothetical protein